MKVLITGAAGFIGKHLAQPLSEAGYEVSLLFRNPRELSRYLEKENLHGIAHRENAVADLSDINQTIRALDAVQPDRLIHLASSGVSNPNLPVDQALRDNLFGTLNLIKACFELESGGRLEKIIVARTPGEGTAMNVYAASKAAAWSFCSMFARTKSFPILGAMIYQTYGPYQPDKLVIPSAFQAAISNQDFPMTSGKQKKDWIYIDDVVSGLLSLLTIDLKPGTVVELGTGIATPLMLVINKIYKLVGGTGKPLKGFIENRTGEESLQVANLNATRDQISWTPQVSLEEGLQTYYAWFSRQHR
ncbi:MAG: SDR family NAD(P)-dependent oxidoreductase [Anaerolineae bacterium]|nr:MAG: SDR family NAD(P)-dependent oxidoreductase [Anaerolineae bacterium]